MRLVYVIGPAEGLQKIGVAADTKKRLDSLQTGNPVRLFVHHSEPVDAAETVERYAHALLAEFREIGEWFNVSIADATDAIRRAAAMVAAGEPMPSKELEPIALSPADFRALLRDCGLRQRKLAERLGVATTTVNRWATGELPVPQYAVAYLELLRELRRIEELARAS